MPKKDTSPSQNALYPDKEFGGGESSRDQKIDKLIDKGFDTELLEMITDLTKNEVRAFVKARTFAKVFDVPLVNEVVTDYMLLLVSKGRKGREELTSLVRSFADDPMSSPGGGGPFSSLFNGSD